MNSRRFPFRFILITLGAFLLAFAPLSAQENEFITIFNAQLPQLDPQRALFSNEAQIHTALYEGLFSYDPQTLEPVRALAESWTKSTSGTIYRFTIRQNASWSDGTPLVADDFVRSWFRMLELNAEYATFFDIIKGAKNYREGIDRNRAHVGIRAVEARVLEVELVRPVAYFTRLLCHQSFSPVHPSLIKEMDWRRAVPFPVSGPYVPVSMSDTELVLEKNPHYWDAASVHIPRLRMYFSDDDEKATSLFNTGHVHWLAGPGNYDQILLKSAIQVFPIFSTHYWFFNCRQKPWDDPRVRRALALLLPWDSLRSTDLYRLPAKTLVLPLPGYSKTRGIERADREEAMKLLAEAGYPNGVGLPPITIAFADYERPKKTAETMKDAWEGALGISVILSPLQPSTYYETIGSRAPRTDFTLAHETWIGDFADPEAFLQMWTTGAPLNIAGYQDREFMDYMEQSYSASDESRMLLLSKAETVLLQQAACLPIYHNFAFSAIDIDYINGWYQNALDIHPYKYLEFGSPSISPNVARAPSGLDSADFHIANK